MFFSRKKKSSKIMSPSNGTVIDLEKVNDEAFASRALGDGVGIKSLTGEVYSPVNGEIVVLFPTLHAIGLRDDFGVEYLIHIGINTVELNGKYFQSYVKQGDKVAIGEKIVSFNKEEVEKKYDTTIIFVITNSNDKTIKILEKQDISINDEIFVMES